MDVSFYTCKLSSISHLGAYNPRVQDFARRLRLVCAAQEGGQVGIVRRAFPDSTESAVRKLAVVISKLARGHDKNPTLRKLAWIAKGCAEEDSSTPLSDFFRQLEIAQPMLTRRLPKETTLDIKKAGPQEEAAHGGSSIPTAAPDPKDPAHIHATLSTTETRARRRLPQHREATSRAKGKISGGGRSRR